MPKMASKKRQKACTDEKGAASDNHKHEQKAYKK